MKKLPWFRMYSDVLTDRKIAKICKSTGHSKALVIGVWTCILSLASESPERGTMLLSDDIPYTVDDLEDETGLPCEVVEQLLDEFRKYDMLVGSAIMKVTNWDKRQYKSDNSTERVREYRKRNDETLQKRYGNALDTEAESETDTDTDTEENRIDKNRSVYDCYEKEIGMITPAIAKKLQDAEDDYTGSWVELAIEEAAKNNVRKWAYVDAILKSWKVNGLQSPKKAATPADPGATLRERGYTAA